ncbi:unnamed protein product [Closterium sp. NIES-54]
MDPAVAIVLGQDPAPFEQLLQRLLSPSNDDRGEAERIFNLCKQQPDALVLRLVAALQSSAAGADVRTIGAVLLRRVITKDSVSLWPQLSPATQATVKTELLASVQREPTKAIWKKLCDTIAELAAGIVESGTWPELLPFMFQCVSSADDRLKEASLLIFAQLVHFFQSQLKPHLPTLHNVLLQCLSQSANPDVRIAALKAAANFVEALETPEELTQFQDLLPGMMQTLNLCLQSKDEASAQEALEMLIEVAGIEPRYMRKQLTDVIAAMLQIAESTQLEDATRHLAIEFLITLSEARERAPGMMRKVPHLVGRLFAVLMAMLLDIEDTPEWHAANDEEEDSGESANYEVAQECLDRLAISVGGNTVLPVASQALPAYSTDADWKKRHAALVCLAQIAEGCTKVMSKSLESVVTMVLAAFNDPNPRVRWAAINAVGQLSTDLGPDLQQQYHARVLPALIAAMDDGANPRVQAHATAAILNFSEAATPEIMAPYLDQLLNKLLQLLQAGDKEQRMLRAKAMEAISLVGMAVGKDKFRADAKEVMQVLVSLQSAPMDDDDLTMSYMLQCLGAEFLPFMHVVMPPLLHSASLKPDVTISDIDDDTANDDDDDDSVETITIGDKKIGIRSPSSGETRAAASSSRTTCGSGRGGRTNTPTARRTADSNSRGGAADGAATQVLRPRGGPQGCLSAHLFPSSHAMPLCRAVIPLRPCAIHPLSQVAQLMVPLLKFYFHEEVRKAAAQFAPFYLLHSSLSLPLQTSLHTSPHLSESLPTPLPIPTAIPELLLDGKLAVEKGMAPAVTATAEGEKRYLKQMVDFLVPPLVEVLTKVATAEGEKRYLKQMVDFLVLPLVEVLTKEPEVEMIVVMLESLQECIQVSPGVSSMRYMILHQGQFPRLASPPLLSPPLSSSPPRVLSIASERQLGGAELSAEQVAQVVVQLKAVVEGSRGRRKERLERTQTEDFDEEESELLQEENEQEDEVLDQVSHALLLLLLLGLGGYSGERGMGREGGTGGVQMGIWRGEQKGHPGHLTTSVCAAFCIAVRCCAVHGYIGGRLHRRAGAHVQGKLQALGPQPCSLRAADDNTLSPLCIAVRCCAVLCGAVRWWQVGDCIGELVRVFKGSFKPFADDLAPFVLQMMVSAAPPTLGANSASTNLLSRNSHAPIPYLRFSLHSQADITPGCAALPSPLPPGVQDKSRPSTERRVGICIFDDLAENMGDAAASLLVPFVSLPQPPHRSFPTPSPLPPTSYFPAFLPHILEAVLDPLPEIRQVPHATATACPSAPTHAYHTLPLAHMALASVHNMVVLPSRHTCQVCSLPLPAHSSLFLAFLLSVPPPQLPCPSHPHSLLIGAHSSTQHLLLASWCARHHVSSHVCHALHPISSCVRHANADTVARLGQVVSSGDSKSELSVSATDNAISALGRLCEHQAHAPFDSAHVLSVWLAYLPIREDRAEAKVAHAQLCGLLERSDARILGPNNQNLPHIVGVLLEAGTDLATEETCKRGVTLLRSLPAEIVGALPPEQQAVLQQALQST